MCIAGPQGGPQPVSLNQHRSTLRVQEGRDPTDNFSSILRTGGASSQRTGSQAPGFGGAQQLGQRSVGGVVDALRSRLAENKRIESGLRGGTLGGGGGASLLGSTASPTQTEDASLVNARKRRGGGSTFLS